MVKVLAQGVGQWMVYDEAQMMRDGYAVSADITRCEDYFMGRVSRFYRVDKGGRTVASMLSTKAEAVTAARRAIKQ